MKPTLASNSVVTFKKKFIGISLLVVALFFILISILLSLAINNKSQSEDIKENVEYNQIDLHYLYINQQELDLRIDSLQLLLFNTILSSTKSEFNQNELILKELMKLKRENIEFRKKNAPNKQSNDFYFSKSQEGESKKLTPQQFITKYNTGFNTIFKKYNIPVPNQRKYELIKTLSIAQGILESGWGSSTLATKYNNWHGIKCQACGGSYLPLRCNDNNSVAYNDDCPKDRFYIYSDYTASIAAHFLLLSSKSKKYNTFITNALKKPSLKSFVKDGKISYADFYKSDVGSLCQDLSGYYATNKDYHKKLRILITKYKLYEVI